MKLSIIIPVHNVEDYLAECLESALAQGNFEYEIICIDDGSSDGSFEIMKAFEQKNPTKIKTVHQKNMGLGATRNKGVRLARGEYILFLDSDDFLTAHSLEKSMEKASVFSPDILEGRTNVIKNNEFYKFFKKKNSLAEVPESGEVFLANKREFSAVVWGKIYKKSFLEKHSIQNAENALYEDVPFSLSAFLKAQKVVNTHTAFYNYRLRDNSMSKTRATEKHLADFVHVRLANYVAHLGQTKNIGAKKMINQKFKKSIWHFLRAIKQSEVGLPVKLKYLSYCPNYFYRGFFAPAITWKKH